MNSIYNYPIIGGIALGIKIIIDSVKYIFKKPALLAFPIIAEILGLLLFIIILVIPEFFISYLTHWQYIKPPIIRLESIESIISDIINFLQNIGTASGKEILGIILLLVSYSLFFFANAALLYFRLYALTGMAKYIQDTSNNLHPSVSKSLRFANLKYRLLTKVSCLLIVLAVPIFILLGYVVSLEPIFFYISSFLTPITAYESPSFSKVFKNLTNFLKTPSSTVTIIIALGGLDIIIQEVTGMEPFFVYSTIFICSAYVLPVAAILLYRHIKGKESTFQ